MAGSKKKDDNYSCKVLSYDENINIFKLIGDQNRVSISYFTNNLKFYYLYFKV